MVFLILRQESKLKKKQIMLICARTQNQNNDFLKFLKTENVPQHSLKIDQIGFVGCNCNFLMGKFVVHLVIKQVFPIR